MIFFEKKRRKNLQIPKTVVILHRISKETLFRNTSVGKKIMARSSIG
jgi:hypothetical protein